ncbi:MAG TPA: acyl carrier protein [Bryobacteraceae bacterium]|nr:acyl carrier protein [Bryobacteraceae bacterium]
MNIEILSEVCSIAGDLFEKDPRSLTAGSSPEDVEKWDSVQHLNLVLALEERYGIQFEPEEMDGMKNLGQVAALVGSKLS